MRILYLHQYFGTPEGAGAGRSYEFARRLVEAGHSVTMVTARRDQSGLDDVPRQTVAGIDVISLGGRPYSNRLTKWQRIVEWIRFTRRASRLRIDTRPDVVFATSTPLTIGIPGVRLARRFRVPFVFEVRDLWPRAPIEMGVLRNPLAQWLAHRLERWIYARADEIVALSPGMTDGVVECGVPKERVTTIPNASDTSLFDPAQRDRLALDRWEIGDRFVAVHAGTMGPANGLDYMIDAAAELARRTSSTHNATTAAAGPGSRGETHRAIVLLILGDGGERPRLEQRVRELGLDNVIFGGQVGRAQTAGVVTACDAAVTCFANVPVLATNSPNKFFDALAAGIPVIVNSNGWTRDIVEQRGAGFYVDAAQPSELADALIRLRDDDTLRERCGAAAREVALTEFDRDLLFTRFMGVLERAVGVPRKSATPASAPR